MDTQWENLAPEYNRYRIYTSGAVFDEKLSKWLGFQENKDGYLKVTLRATDGRRKTFSVHRLVASCFIPNPENKETVNHIDGLKNNNSIYNLEWATRSEQTQHAWDNGFIKDLESRKQGIRDKQSKLVMCVQTGEVFKSLGEAAEIYNLKKSNISAVCHGKIGANSAGNLNGVKLTWRFVEND